MLADLDRAMGEAQLRRKDREVGQVNMFEMMGGGENEGEAGSKDDFASGPIVPEVQEMEEFEKLKLEKQLLGFFLSGHPVDTIGGLGNLLDDFKSEDLENLEGKGLFVFVALFPIWKKRYTKKDAKAWARFTLMAKEKDFSLPMFSDAFERYGPKLVEGEIMVVEGVVSIRDGETRMSVNSAVPLDAALVELVEEVTWLLDTEDDETIDFLEEIFSLGEKGRGKTLIRFGFAKESEPNGLVVETDERFKMRFDVETFMEWRHKTPVRGARVKMSPSKLPPERSYGGRQGRYD